MKKNILYCGMADDILSPILLVPDFDTIFVIDSFDRAFAKDNTWEGQKEDIIQMLSLGNDEHSQHRDVLVNFSKRKNVPIICLKEPCNVISQSDDGNVFRVKFNYLGKTRNLIYFHHRNYFTTWPDEVKKISHLMSMGAAFAFKDETADVSYTRTYADKFGAKDMFGPRVEDSEVCITKMLAERTTKNCIYYTNTEFHVTRTMLNHARGQVFTYELSDMKGDLKVIYPTF
ncbi:MAG: hypothetical protein AABY15_03335 [Nanoarchaeota archaeon]